MQLGAQDISGAWAGAEAPVPGVTSRYAPCSPPQGPALPAASLPPGKPQSLSKAGGSAAADPGSPRPRTLCLREKDAANHGGVLSAPVQPCCCLVKATGGYLGAAPHVSGGCLLLSPRPPNQAC